MFPSGLAETDAADAMVAASSGHPFRANNIRESGDAELFGDSAAPGLVIVDNRDASALGGKEPGAGFANPGSRTRNDRRLILQSHASPLESFEPYISAERRRRPTALIADSGPRKAQSCDSSSEIILPVFAPMAGT